MPREMWIFRGHSEDVTSVALSQDGKKIVSGSKDSTIQVWDAMELKKLGCLRGHEKDVTSVVLSRDGKKIISGSKDSTIRIWDAVDLKALGVLRGHEDEVNSVIFGSNEEWIISGGWDGVKVWDADRLEELDYFATFDLVSSLSSVADGCKVVLGGNSRFRGLRDNIIQVWDARFESLLGELKGGHLRDVTSVSFSADGKKIVSGGGDTVRVWDAVELKAIGVLRGHKLGVKSVAWSPNGDRIASSGCMDGAVRIWDAHTLNDIGVLEGHKHTVNSIAWSSDGGTIVSGGEDGTVRLWDIRDLYLTYYLGYLCSYKSFNEVSGKLNNGIFLGDHGALGALYSSCKVGSKELARFVSERGGQLNSELRSKIDKKMLREIEAGEKKKLGLYGLAVEALKKKKIFELDLAGDFLSGRELDEMVHLVREYSALSIFHLGYQAVRLPFRDFVYLDRRFFGALEEFFNYIRRMGWIEKASWHSLFSYCVKVCAPSHIEYSVYLVEGYGFGTLHLAAWLGLRSVVLLLMDIGEKFFKDRGGRMPDKVALDRAEGLEKSLSGAFDSAFELGDPESLSGLGSEAKIRALVASLRALAQELKGWQEEKGFRHFMAEQAEMEQKDRNLVLEKVTTQPIPTLPQ